LQTFTYSAVGSAFLVGRSAALTPPAAASAAAEAKRRDLKDVIVFAPSITPRRPSRVLETTIRLAGLRRFPVFRPTFVISLIDRPASYHSSMSIDLYD
jgi:hypothetical protein